MININKKKLLLLIIVIVLGSYIFYRLFLADRDNLLVSERRVNEMLDIPVITIDDGYLGQNNIRFKILKTVTNESYGYYEAKNMNDNDKLKLFVQLYGIKGGYDFPLASKYKEYIIEDNGNFDINNVTISWKSLYVGENAEYELMYNIDLNKSKYLIIASVEKNVEIDKINEYIRMKLKNNKELIEYKHSN